jgi:hypothetical protein
MWRLSSDIDRLKNSLTYGIKLLLTSTMKTNWNISFKFIQWRELSYNGKSKHKWQSKYSSTTSKDLNKACFPYAIQQWFWTPKEANITNIVLERSGKTDASIYSKMSCSSGWIITTLRRSLLICIDSTALS